MTDIDKTVELAKKIARYNGLGRAFAHNTPSENEYDLACALLALKAELAKSASLSDSHALDLKAMRDNHDMWKWEYENLCKFATQFEYQRDTARAEAAVLRDQIKTALLYIGLYTRSTDCDVSVVAAESALNTALSQTSAPKLLEVVKAAESLDEYWFDASNPESGACILCDGNMHPDLQGKHGQVGGKPCPIQLMHDALKAYRNEK